MQKLSKYAFSIAYVWKRAHVVALMLERKGEATARCPAASCSHDDFHHQLCNRQILKLM